MAPREDRIGFVAEDFEADDGGRLTGTFSAHWEARDHSEWRRGPEGVSAEEAIAWARKHATRVSILLYDDSSLYSAGEVPYPELPPWPDEGMVLRPRPIGAPRDGSIQEIPWQVRAEVRGRATADQRARVRELIAADPKVAKVEVAGRWRRLTIDFDYTARSTSAAGIAADALVETAVAEVLPNAWVETTGVGG